MSKHIQDVGMTHAEHRRHALIISRHMLIGGIALLVHSIFPDWFVTTGSDHLTKAVEQRNKIQ